MSSLGGNELYKYPKGNVRDRVPLFLKKYKSKDPFELNSGQKVTFVYDDSVAKLVEKRQPIKGILLVDTKKKLYKFSDLKKNAEFGGSAGTGVGSGAGAEATDLTESSQALYAAAKWNKTKDWNDGDLKAAYSKCDVTEPLKNILSTLPGDWVASCKLGADKLYKEFGNKGKQYTFHRQSAWVKKLEDHFKKLNREGKVFSNINKWSPADIYLVSVTGARAEITKTKSIVELNNLLKEMLDSKDIIGVSLKKIGGNEAHFSYVNVGEKKEIIKFDGYTVAKKNFFSSKDVNIDYTVGGEIQFRTFTFAPSSWQGEISGEFAKHGKVSYGQCYKILESLTQKRKLTNATTLRSKFDKGDEETLKTFYSYYVKYDKKDTPKLKYEEFISEYNKKDDKVSWGYSKYLGCEIIDIILSTKIEDQFVAKAVQYATSQSDLSAPFCKME